MEIATRNNSTIHGKPPAPGIAANSFSKLLLQFEDFVASTDSPGVVRSVSSSNRPAPENLNSAKHLAQRQPQQCIRKQPPVTISKMNHQFNKFGDYPTKHKNGLRSILTSSNRNLYSRRSSQGSPTSTHSSPILHTSSSTQSSPTLPSSTHSSPILYTPQSPSPPHNTPFSQIPHVPPSMQGGVDATAPTNSGQNNATALASKRDPVTNKIVITTLVNQKKDNNDSMPVTSMSVIAPKPTTSCIRKKAAEPAESQPSAPFSLPPLSVKTMENEKQQALPDLLKPKNLAKYVQASAPKKKPVEKSSLTISVLLDHDYTRPMPEEKPVEKKLKRKFIIPKKKAGSSLSGVGADCETQDNLEVVDMECSDMEDDGTIIVDDSSASLNVKNKEPSLDEFADAPEIMDMLLYGRDTFRTECKLIDEEAELRYLNEPNLSATDCMSYNCPLRQLGPFDFFDTLCSDNVETEPVCTTEVNVPESTTWWDELDEILEKFPKSEISTSLSEETGNLVESDAAAASVIDSFINETEILNPGILCNPLEPEFLIAPIDAAKNPDSEPNNLYVDPLYVKEEIVESSPVSEVVVPTQPAMVPTQPAMVPTQPATVPTQPAVVTAQPAVVTPKPAVMTIQQVPADVHTKEPMVTKVSNQFVHQVERRLVGTAGVQVVGGVRYVSLLDVMPQSVSETSDTGSMSSDDSKENMLDKVPAYILTSGRLGTRKNVLQRLDIKQDTKMTSEDSDALWDETCQKYSCSPDRNSSSTSNGYESGSPSTSEFSEPSSRTRSPSPDYARRSYSSRHSRHESYKGRSYRRRNRSRSRSPSRSRSRSRSRSPIYSYKTSRTRAQRQAERNAEEEQRRVVYVGKLPNSFTDAQLIALFRKHGEIEKVSLHFRSGKDNYGFVTFVDKVNATRCLEATHQNPNFPYEVCYGGRREFCKEDYADLDGITEQQEEFGPVVRKNGEASFEQLLKQYSRARRH